ncbi:MAG: hypothetical protein WCH34_17015, partial [Bacteroidota bacterium]
MKKSSSICSKIAILLIFLFAGGSVMAQNSIWPYFNLELRNDIQVSPTEYQFDIFIVHTGNYTTPINFETSGIQVGIYVNDEVRNGGTLTDSLVAGSTSDMNLIQRQTQANLSISNSSPNKCIAITAKSAGAGSGTIISKTQGTRLMRVRLFNSVPFGQARPNLSFVAYTAPVLHYPTKVNARIGVNSVNISGPTNGGYNQTNVTTSLYNPILNSSISYHMTGGGIYCIGGAPMVIGLDGSQLGYNYQLKKDGIDYGAPIPGTGNPLSWSVSGPGTYTCTAGTVNMIGSAVITVNTASVLISAENLSICSGTPINFTAAATNGGNAPVFNWYVSGIQQQGHTSTFQVAPNASSDVYCIMTPNAACISGNPVTSNTLNANVNPTPDMPIGSASQIFCAGSFPTVGDLNATATGMIQWYDVSTGGIPIDPSTALTNNTHYYASQTSEYGCESARFDVLVTIYPLLNPTVSITATQLSVCDGNMVTFTATPANEGTAAFYNWYLNGDIQIGHDATFSYLGAPGTYNVYCEMISSEICISANPAISNTLILTVNPIPDPPISGGNVVVCSNQLPATLVDIVPVGMNVNWYDAQIGGNLLASGTNYITSTPGTYYNETVDPISGCTSATRTAVSLTVNNVVTPSVAIVANYTNVCSGSIIKFTATPTDGGISPIYNWYVGGILQAGHLAVLQISATTSSNVYCTMASSVVCVSANPVQSNTINYTVSPIVTPSVSIVADNLTVCAGTQIHYTATPVNGGTNPIYYWYRGGVLLTGGHSASISIGTTLSSNVYCKMTSNAACVSTNPVLSNTINYTVNPILTPSVSLTADFPSYCLGSSANITANPINGGTNPIFNWYVGGNLQAEHTSTLQITPNSSVIVYCKVTSNAACVIGNPAISNTLLITINPHPAPPVSNGDVTVCASTLPATLIDLVPQGMEVKWYDAPQGGNFLTDGANYITSTAGTYYNETINPLTGCISLTRTAVVLTINDNPAAPVSGGDITVCSNSLPATLIDLVPQGMEVKWYDAPQGGNFLADGTNYITSTAGTYYNETVNPLTGCVSSTRTSVVLTVNPNNVFPVETHSICQGETYVWHGQTLTIAGPYTAQETNTYGCIDT